MLADVLPCRSGYIFFCHNGIFNAWTIFNNKLIFYITPCSPIIPPPPQLSSHLQEINSSGSSATWFQSSKPDKVVEVGLVVQNTRLAQEGAEQVRQEGQHPRRRKEDVNEQVTLLPSDHHYQLPSLPWCLLFCVCINSICQFSYPSRLSRNIIIALDFHTRRHEQ